VSGRTAVTVDSCAYLPKHLVAEHGLLVVPLTVTIDGRSYQEGVDITPEEFYRVLPEAKSVSTSQPSPGEILACYREAAGLGAESVLSIHIGAGVSGTVQAATIAARESPLPVTIVDTGQASFAEGLCAWEAVEALKAGASAEEAASAARAASGRVGNTFVVRALGLMKKGGRLLGEGGQSSGAPVLALTTEGVRPIGMAGSLEEAVETMAEHVHRAVERLERGQRLRIGIGHGAAEAIAGELRSRVEKLDGIEEIIDYTVGL
jgi:DegV family protein with EDD domain